MNSEGSLKSSIANLVRRKPGSKANGFQFSQVLFSQQAAAASVAAAAPGETTVTPKRKSAGASITGALKNKTKLEFMNTPVGCQIRRGSGAHVAITNDRLGSCVVCGTRTSNACMTCSSSASTHGFNSSVLVVFYACKNKAQTPAGRLLSKSCFYKMHSADQITPNSSQKVVSGKLAQHLRNLHEGNAAKRAHVDAVVGQVQLSDDEDENEDEDE